MVFGHDEFGWRISAAVAGILSVLLVVRIARRLFGSTVLGCAAGLLLALDGIHLVLSRTALLDIFLMLFVLAAFGCAGARPGPAAAPVAARAGGRPRPDGRGRAGRQRLSWRDGVPWWRLAAGRASGCALAVKWSALFFLPAFVLLVLWWEVGARRSGRRAPAVAGHASSTRPAGSSLLGVVLVVVYLASWAGWFATDDG